MDRAIWSENPGEVAREVDLDQGPLKAVGQPHSMASVRGRTGQSPQVDDAVTSWVIGGGHRARQGCHVS